MSALISLTQRQELVMGQLESENEAMGREVTYLREELLALEASQNAMVNAAISAKAVAVRKVVEEYEERAAFLSKTGEAKMAAKVTLERQKIPQALASESDSIAASVAALRASENARYYQACNEEVARTSAECMKKVQDVATFLQMAVTKLEAAMPRFRDRTGVPVNEYSPEAFEYRLRIMGAESALSRMRETIKLLRN